MACVVGNINWELDGVNRCHDRHPSTRSNLGGLAYRLCHYYMGNYCILTREYRPGLEFRENGRSPRAKKHVQPRVRHFHDRVRVMRFCHYRPHACYLPDRPGIGGAFLMANSLAIITEAFPPQERGKVFGFNSIIWAIGSITGIAIGGIIVTFVSWRWIFIINVPVGIVGTIWAYVTLHPDKASEKKESFDFPAAIAFTLSLVFLLIGITLGLLNGWGDLLALIFIGISPLFFIAFIVWELKFSQDPIIPFSLFRNRVFTFSVITVLFQSLALFSVNFLLVFYFEGIAGLSPLTASFLIIPLSVVNAIVGPFAGRWSDKVGARIVATLGLLVQFGMLVVLTQLTISTPLWVIGTIEALFGLGGGLFYPANTSTVMSSSPPGRYGVTSGILATFRNTGMIMSFVVSIIAATSAIPAYYVYQLFIGTLTTGLPPAVAVSYLAGQSTAFTLSCALILAAAFFSLIRGRLVHQTTSKENQRVEPDH